MGPAVTRVPEPVQVLAFAVTTVIVVDCPKTMVVGEAVTVTVGATFVPALSVFGATPLQPIARHTPARRTSTLKVLRRSIGSRIPGRPPAYLAWRVSLRKVCNPYRSKKSPAWPGYRTSPMYVSGRDGLLGRHSAKHVTPNGRPKAPVQTIDSRIPLFSPVSQA